MGKERHTKESAVSCLTRNGVRVTEEYNKDTDKVDRMIVWTRPIGLKVRAAVDCLCHYHHFSRAAKVR